MQKCKNAETQKREKHEKCKTREKCKNAKQKNRKIECVNES